MKMQHIKPFAKRLHPRRTKCAPALPQGSGDDSALLQPNPNPRFLCANMPNHRTRLQKPRRPNNFHKQKRQSARHQKERSKKSHKPRLAEWKRNSKFKNYKKQNQSTCRKVLKNRVHLVFGRTISINWP